MGETQIHLPVAPCSLCVCGAPRSLRPSRARIGRCVSYLGPAAGDQRRGMRALELCGAGCVFKSRGRASDWLRQTSYVTSVASFWLRQTGCVTLVASHQLRHFGCVRLAASHWLGRTSCVVNFRGSCVDSLFNQQTIQCDPTHDETKTLVLCAEFGHVDTTGCYQIVMQV